MPVGCVSWAFASDEIEQRMRQGVWRLAPGEWKSGEDAWLMDVIVPFGGQDKAIAEVRETALKGRRVKAFQSVPGGGTAVIEW